jgi:hypothetical protein
MVLVEGCVDDGHLALAKGVVERVVDVLGGKGRAERPSRGRLFLKSSLMKDPAGFLYFAGPEGRVKAGLMLPRGLVHNGEDVFTVELRTIPVYSIIRVEMFGSQRKFR